VSTVDRHPSLLAQTGATALGIAWSLLALTGCGERATTPTSERKASPAQAASPTVDAAKLRTKATVPFEHSWDLALPRPVHLSWVSPNIPDLFFVQLEGANEIYAIDAMSGRTRFVTPPLPRPLALPPSVARVVMPSGRVNETVNDDRLYLISDDRLFCFDAIYGEKVWGYDLPFTAASGPLAVGPEGNLRVFIGDFAGKLQVITWSPEKRGFVYPLWQFPVFAPITAQPVETESLVYAGDHSGAMNCFRLDRELVWKFKAGGRTMDPADIAGRILYFGSNDNVFYALNRLSGEELAKLYLNAPIDRAPFHFAAEPGRIYVWTSHADPALGGLWAISAKSDTLDITHNLDAQNKPRKKEIVRLGKSWFLPGATRLVSSTPDHLYVTRGDRTLVEAVSRATGAVDWAWDLNEGRKDKDKDRVVHLTSYFDPTDQNRSIFAVDARNQVHAYRLFGYKPKEGSAALAPAPAPTKPAAKKPSAAAAPAADAAPAEAPAAN